jgi:hypothetical protein
VIKRDWPLILAALGTVVACYMMVAGWKSEIRADMSRIDARLDAVDHRIFYLATGRDLDEVIKEEHLKARALTQS